MHHLLVLTAASALAAALPPLRGGRGETGAAASPIRRPAQVRGQRRGEMTRKSRQLTAFCISAAFAFLGDGAAAVVLTLRVRPAGPGWVAALIAAVFVPAVALAPVTGFLIDRYGSRRILAAGYVIEAALALLLIPVTSPAGTIALAAAHGVMLSLTGPAILAFVPQIVGQRRADAGYVGYGTAVAAAQVLGPLAGGLLETLAPMSVFVVESAGCLTMAGMCPFMKERGTGQPGSADADNWEFGAAIHERLGFFYIAPIRQGDCVD
jgi:MFS family permease